MSISEFILTITFLSLCMIFGVLWAIFANRLSQWNIEANEEFFANNSGLYNRIPSDLIRIMDFFRTHKRARLCVWRTSGIFIALVAALMIFIFTSFYFSH